MFQNLAKELVTTKRYGGNPLHGDWAQAEDIFPWPSVPSRVDVEVTLASGPVTLPAVIDSLDSLDDLIRFRFPANAVSPLRNKRHRTL